MNYFMNPTIMRMANELNIEYCRLCGIFAILDSLDKYQPNALIRNATAATLLGIDGDMPCTLDVLLGAFDTFRYGDDCG